MDFTFPLLDIYGTPILIVLFVLLLILESIFTLRVVAEKKKDRVLRNGTLSIAGFLVLRIGVLPFMALSAHYSGALNFGLLNWVQLPFLAELLIAFLLFDYGMYLWHRMNHNIGFLWRFHNVHHTDLEMDVTTALRFHFGEIVFSIIFRSLIVFLIGASLFHILIYELFFQAATAFHHSNLKLPYGLEKYLVKLIVTPRMHGIHHSIYLRETNSNYATIFAFWDKLHGTKNFFSPQDKIIIGVPAWRDGEELKVKDLYLLPFKAQRSWKLPDGTSPLTREDKNQSISSD